MEDVVANERILEPRSPVLYESPPLLPYGKEQWGQNFTESLNSVLSGMFMFMSCPAESSQRQSGDRTQTVSQGRSVLARLSKQ